MLFPVNILHGLDSSRTLADLDKACHTRAQAGWAEGGQAQVQPKYLGLPTFLLGRARLGLPLPQYAQAHDWASPMGMPKHEGGQVHPSTWTMLGPARAVPT